jgi:putative transposase
MQLLDQQYFNTPFYGCRKLTFWLKDLGFKVNQRVRRLMQIINWQTIYREPKTTMSNKEHKKHPYLLKDLKISHKKIRCGQQISLIFLWQKGLCI